MKVLIRCFHIRFWISQMHYYWRLWGYCVELALWKTFGNALFYRALVTHATVTVTVHSAYLRITWMIFSFVLFCIAFVVLFVVLFRFFVAFVLWCEFYFVCFCCVLFSVSFVIVFLYCVLFSWDLFFVLWFEFCFLCFVWSFVCFVSFVWFCVSFFFVFCINLFVLFCLCVLFYTFLFSFFV